MEITGKMFLEYKSTTEGPLDKVVDLPQGVFVDEDYGEEYIQYQVFTKQRYEVTIKLKNTQKGLVVSFDFFYPNFPVQDGISYYINGPFDGEELVVQSGNDIYSMNTRNLLLNKNELILKGGFIVFEWAKNIFHEWRFLMVFEDEALHEHFSNENVEWVI
ncbi:hypothetical protein [Robiginitalea aurantiaca]|uniref:Uncharacterized protein n=1 Tax=Robiginitalea aurantiaca TaxID=3056915 RepID=A0ABT7WBG3_9FLAO|nr:hypothetical protein [Robiginitalea aurantiaca]MDM9630248.1 hypothetical protein [Robiginitalea aurantiaca]